MAVHLNPNTANHAGMRSPGHTGHTGKSTGKSGPSDSKGKSSEKTADDPDGAKNGTDEASRKVGEKSRGGRGDGSGGGQGNPDGNPHQSQSAKKTGKAGKIGEIAKTVPIVRSNKPQSQSVRREANVTTKVAMAQEHKGGAVELTAAHCKKFEVDRRSLEVLPSAALSSRSTIKNAPFSSRFKEVVGDFRKSIAGLFSKSPATAAMNPAHAQQAAHKSPASIPVSRTESQGAKGQVQAALHAT